MYVTLKVILKLTLYEPFKCASQAVFQKKTLHMTLKMTLEMTLTVTLTNQLLFSIVFHPKQIFAWTCWINYMDPSIMYVMLKVALKVNLKVALMVVFNRLQCICLKDFMTTSF